MEEKTKNFDRNIEQLMNESSVAPPFGMWNRISSELDATYVMPIAVVAPVTAISRRISYGIIAATAIIGSSLLTALYMSSTQKTSSIEKAESQTNHPVSTSSVTHPAVVLSNGKATDDISITAKPNIKHETTSIQVKPSLVKTAANSISSKTALANTEVAVPIATITTNYKAEDVYFFPPVDMASTVVNTENEPKTTETVGSEKPVEKKTKSISNSSNDKRIVIKKRKRGGFSYGSLNRTRKQRPKY